MDAIRVGRLCRRLNWYSTQQRIDCCVIVGHICEIRSNPDQNKAISNTDAGSDPMKHETILVTGGAGFIGARLVRSLLKIGYKVRILDSLTQQVHGSAAQDLEWLSGDGIQFFKGSVACRADWELAMEGVDQIVHLAAETGTGQSMYEVAKYCETNLMGTALMIDVLCNRPARSVRRVLLASSRSIYGEGSYTCAHCGTDRLNPGARPASQLRGARWEPVCPRCAHGLTAIATAESDPVNPASIYAATKHAQEDLVRIGCGSIGLDYAILRLQNVYGEGQSLHNPYTGILSIFSTRIRLGLDLPIFEDGMESRDFIHVDDVVSAIVLGLNATGALNDVLNVGTGIATSVLSLAAELARSLHREGRIVVTGQFRIGDIRHNYADISRIRIRLGFIPCVCLSSGLEKFAEWVDSQPLPEDRLEQANRELKKRGLMA